jgi:excisionase family DNA binding protein
VVGWYDIDSISKYCERVSKRTVETWIRKEGLRYVKIGGKRFVKREWLDEFLESHEATKAGKEVDKIVEETLKEMSL